MRWAMLLAVLTAGACGGEEYPYCREAYAYKSRVEQVWAQAFGTTSGECPCVRWRQRETLDCTRWASGPDGWRPTVPGQGNGWITDTDEGRTCVYGVSDVRASIVEALEVRDLGHELVHHWLYRRSGSSDSSHAGREWRAGGAVEKLVAMLEAAAVRPE